MPEGKKGHLKCSGAKLSVTCTGVVREAGEAEGDPALPAKHGEFGGLRAQVCAWVLGQLAWPVAPRGLLLAPEQR